MRKNKKGIFDKEKGQSFTELALMFVTLMLIVSALVDFGRLLYTYMSLVDSAQEGFLYWSINPEDISGAGDRVRNSTSFPADMASVAVPNPPLPVGKSYYSELCTGDIVTLSITYPFRFTMPFINLIVPSNTINLHASATGPILTPMCP